LKRKENITQNKIIVGRRLESMMKGSRNMKKVEKRCSRAKYQERKMFPRDIERTLGKIHPNSERWLIRIFKKM